MPGCLPSHLPAHSCRPHTLWTNMAEHGRRWRPWTLLLVRTGRRFKQRSLGRPDQFRTACWVSWDFSLSSSWLTHSRPPHKLGAAPHASWAARRVVSAAWHRMPAAGRSRFLRAGGENSHDWRAGKRTDLSGTPGVRSGGNLRILVLSLTLYTTPPASSDQEEHSPCLSERPLPQGTCLPGQREGRMKFMG